MADLFQIQKDEFDVLYAEAVTMPRIFVFQNHPLIMGRAHRILYFDRLIEHMKAHDGVWFCTFKQLSDFWRQHHDRSSNADDAIRTLGFRSAQIVAGRV
jgi:hypothetical protein